MNTHKHSHLSRVLLIILLLIPLTNTYSQNISSIKDIVPRINNVINEIEKAMSVAMLGSTDWSSSFIGNFPHFGIGVNTSLALANATNITQALTNFSSSAEPDTSSEAFPGVGLIPNMKFRIGGWNFTSQRFPRYPKVPFDIGVHIAYIPDSLLNSIVPELSNMIGNLNLLNIGVDIRVPIFEEQRLVPGLTMGFTYMYNNVNMKNSLSSSLFPEEGVEFQLVRVKMGNINYEAQTHLNILGIKAQTSKRMLFFEPFLGVEPFLFWTNTSLKGDNLDIQVGDQNGENFQNYRDYLRTLGVPLNDDYINFQNDSLSYKKDTISGGIRVYGGFGIVISAFALDIGVSYEIIHDVLSLNLGSRLAF